MDGAQAKNSAYGTTASPSREEKPYATQLKT
jgi:hypothetical protein